MERKRKAINIDVGRRIRTYRERANMTREQLAEAAEITPRFVADLERGTVGASLTTLKKICEALAISSDNLLWDDRDLSSIAARLSGVDSKYLSIIDEILVRQLELIKLAKEDEPEEDKPNA